MSNDTETLTLSDFLLARITEDEHVARRPADPRWHTTRPDPNGPWELHDEYLVSTFGRISYPQYADHIARHDPARVLAECEAKRRIVGWCGAFHRIQVAHLGYPQPSEDDFVPGGPKHPDDAVVLRFMAQPYADHPDFRDEWRS